MEREVDQLKDSLCDNGIILYADHGGDSHTNLHMWWHGIEIHILYQSQFPSFGFVFVVQQDVIFGRTGCGVYGTSLYYVCNFLWIQNYFKIKS